MIQRRVRDWDLGLSLTTPGDCTRPDVRSRLREKLLPEIFETLAAIVEGKIIEWGMPPDDVFLRSLESHLGWPVLGTRDHLIVSCEEDRQFADALQSWMSAEMNWTFDPEHPENWRATLDRASRTLCYIFCNRAIFYEAIRARYPEHLDELRMPRRGRGGHADIYRYFRNQFQRAVTESGDYEPIFYPQVADWAGALVFASDTACQGWKGVFNNLAQYNFRQIPYDIIGGIFQKLISPEERQKFGQFYTNEDIIDIINAFCIHRAGDKVIDPSCGSGSFLVRAYHRKAWLSEQPSGGRRNQDAVKRKRHYEFLQEIFGCDIALFAAHLATLNLAARQITEEENYPQIARGNFFEVVEDLDHFCAIPGMPTAKGEREKAFVHLTKVDAVVGNPPYVRQEHIPKRGDVRAQKGETKQAHAARLKQTKEHLQELCSRMWPGLRLSGRSDLHCYFWPVAAGLLKQNGHFGFLTSSSWLDVEYGFALQGWALKNFKIIAVIESLDEPWFEDARVKTAVTILQRCEDEGARMANVVKFVRLFKPVREILGDRPHGDETARQNSAIGLRQRILRTSKALTTDEMRIVPVAQSQLWKEGVRAADLLRSEFIEQTPDANGNEGDDESNGEAIAMEKIRCDYAAGKWGRFLRAPDLYFRLLREYGDRFVRLGEIAEVRRGITSGCDAFFMPRDVTDEVLRRLREGLPWNDVGIMAVCKRGEVESGKVRIVRAGDNTLHPIETEYVRPEVHSLMQVDRPVVHAGHLDRVVLWVNRPLNELTGTYVAKYIRWGARQTFASKKSKAVPVPQRSTCAARPLWYDLTTERMGVAFWPKTQKYRHIVPSNPARLVCNCNLYTVIPELQEQSEELALAAILNSTIVALFKCFYGRYAGAEGTLKTEVVDTVLLEIPDPRGVSEKLAARLSRALEQISGREVTHLVERALLECHSEQVMREILTESPQLPSELRQEDRRELDLCVLELIGVKYREDRERLLDELYYETTNYYRYQRTQDIQSMENRAGGNNHRLEPKDLAESIWHSLSDSERGPSVAEWISSTFRDAHEVKIPEGKPRALGADDMFNPSTVIFRGSKETYEVSYSSPEQAALVAELAVLGVRGSVPVPESATACSKCSELLTARIQAARERFAELAAMRTGTVALQEKTTSLLTLWFVHGKE